MTTYNNAALWWFVDADFCNLLEALLNTNGGYGPGRRRVRTFQMGIELLLQILESILVKAIVWLYGREASRQQPGGENRLPKILFTAQDWQWRGIRDEETGSFRKSDAFFDSVLRKLIGKCEFIGVDPLTRLHPALLRTQIPKWKILVDKLQTWNIPQRPFELYWSLDAWRTERAASKHFNRCWQNLLRDSRFRVICRPAEEKTDGWIEAKLEYYFHVIFPRAARYIQMTRRMIERERPDLILLLNEYGFFEQAIVVAGKQLDIPTLALQHGIMACDKRFMYVKSEISPYGSAASPFRPIPDRIAVYGPRWKRLLTKVSAYPGNCVVVTGQPRYDRLYHVNRLYSKSGFLRKYRITSNRQIVLWTTQCNGLSMEENIRNFEAVFGAMRSVDNTTLIVKQHPGEGEMHTRIMKQYLEHYGTDALIIPGSSDTYELLFVCDLMITKHSATAMEAVALGKPVVILDLSGRPDTNQFLDYVREGVALGVYEKEHLALSIKELLSDDSELSKNRQNFVKKFLYRIDGKSTERVVSLMWEMSDTAR